MNRRCVIYCRRSRKEKKAEEYDRREPSIEQQLRECLKTAAEQNFQVVTQFQEVGPATGKGRTRPEFAKVLELATAGDVDVILVWEEERISRNNVDNQDLLEAEKANVGLEIWSVEGRIPWRNFESGGGKETRKLTKRTERGWRASMRQGKPGPGPNIKYGYRRDENKKSPRKGFAEIHPENAEYVRAIFDLYIEGLGAREITEALKAKSCKRSFSRMCLNRMIKDETYVTGVQLMTRKAKVGFAEETFKIQFPPIIDDPTWAAAQKRLATNKGSNRAQAPLKFPSLLAGLIWCEEHNYKMHLLNRPEKYRCGCDSKKLQAPNPGCAKSVSIDWLDRAVWQQVRHFVNTPSLLDQLIDNRAAELSVSIRDNVEDEILRLTKRLAELDTEADRYMKLYGQDTSIPKELLEKQVLGIEFEKAAAQKELASAESELIVKLEPAAIKKAARKLLNNSDWKAAQLENFTDDLPAARRLVRKCVEKVTVQPGTAGTKVPTIYFEIDVPAVQMPSATELELTTPNTYHVPASG